MFKANDPYEKIAIRTSASPGRLGRMDNEIEIALRRRIVLAYLDNAVTTVGQNYDFHGPIFVHVNRKRHLSPSPLTKFTFKLAAMASNHANSRPHLDKSDIDALFWEVCEKCSLIPEYEDHSAIWDRPIQEFSLY